MRLAKQADLIQYMLAEHPDRVFYRTGTLRDCKHDSLVIYHDSYFRSMKPVTASRTWQNTRDTVGRMPSPRCLNFHLVMMSLTNIKSPRHLWKRTSTLSVFRLTLATSVPFRTISSTSVTSATGSSEIWYTWKSYMPRQSLERDITMPASQTLNKITTSSRIQNRADPRKSFTQRIL